MGEAHITLSGHLSITEGEITYIKTIAQWLKLAVKHDSKLNKIKEKDHLLPIVTEYIYELRKKKTGEPYKWTAKHSVILKSLCKLYGHAKIMAAWDFFINDKIDKFWTDGYLVDTFFNPNCIAKCQIHPAYYERVQLHTKTIEGVKQDNAKSV